MAAHIDQSMRLKRTRRRPLWLSILAIFSLLLGIMTTIPQFYYVLFGLPLVTIGPALSDLSALARSGFAFPARAFCRERVRHEQDSCYSRLMYAYDAIFRRYQK